MLGILHVVACPPQYQWSSIIQTQIFLPLERDIRYFIFDSMNNHVKSIIPNRDTILEFYRALLLENWWRPCFCANPIRNRKCIKNIVSDNCFPFLHKTHVSQEMQWFLKDCLFFSRKTDKKGHQNIKNIDKDTLYPTSHWIFGIPNPQ